MSTEAQINANRLSAQKSTGPVTPEGKAKSALDALKSALTLGPRLPQATIGVVWVLPVKLT